MATVLIYLVHHFLILLYEFLCMYLACEKRLQFKKGKTIPKFSGFNNHHCIISYDFLTRNLVVGQLGNSCAPHNAE